MRTKKSFFNIFSGFVNNVVLNVLRFVVRTVLIKTIGEVYLGVNGLLSNILGLLALADLGISTAIGYSLYKPLQEKDDEKVKSLMLFFKKAYFIIGIVVLISGLAILPFLGFFVSKEDWISGLNIYYLIFLANMVIGYFFAYKRTLIIADQNEYKINYFIIAFNLLQNIFQIIVLVLYQNYILYLLVQIFTTLLENVVINRYIDKQYAYLKSKDVKKLEVKEKKRIFADIRALMYHKIGSYFVDSTDNLIISKFVGLVTVGLYSNYYLIVSVLNKFINTAIWSLVAPLGNLNVSETKEKKEEVFNTITFISFAIFTICSACLINLFNLFIGDLWLGAKFVLPMSVVVIITVNFYISGMMHVNDAVKTSAGLYTKDKFVPIIQSIINIVFSVILVQKYGLVGIFIGTLISSILPTVVKPIIIYKYMFSKSSLSYFKKYFGQLLVSFISIYISYFIVTNISLDNIILYFLFAFIVSVLVPLIMILVVYCNDEGYIDAKKRLEKILKGVKKRNA